MNKVYVSTDAQELMEILFPDQLDTWNCDEYSVEGAKLRNISIEDGEELKEKLGFNPMSVIEYGLLRRESAIEGVAKRLARMGYRITLVNEHTAKMNEDASVFCYWPFHETPKHYVTAADYLERDNNREDILCQAIVRDYPYNCGPTLGLPMINLALYSNRPFEINNFSDPVDNEELKSARHKLELIAGRR